MLYYLFTYLPLCIQLITIKLAIRFLSYMTAYNLIDFAKHHADHRALFKQLDDYKRNQYLKKRMQK